MQGYFIGKCGALIALSPGSSQWACNNRGRQPLYSTYFSQGSKVITPNNYVSGGEPGDEVSAFIRERKGEGERGVESGRRSSRVVRREEKEIEIGSS